MATRTKRIILYGGAAVFLGAFAIWLVARTPSPTAVPGLGFVGLTNSSNAILAQFRITNSIGYRAYFALGLVEVDYGAGWPTSGITAGRAMYEIPVGGVTNVLVPVPAPQKPWRLPVGYARYPSRFESSVRSVTEAIGWQRPMWHSNTFQVYTAYGYPVPQ